MLNAIRGKAVCQLGLLAALFLPQAGPWSVPAPALGFLLSVLAPGRPSHCWKVHVIRCGAEHVPRSWQAPARNGSPFA